MLDVFSLLGDLGYDECFGPVNADVSADGLIPTYVILFQDGLMNNLVQVYFGVEAG